MTSPVAAASEGMASLRMNPAALPFTRPSHDARSGVPGGGWGHAPLVAAALIFQQGAQGHLSGSGGAGALPPSVSEESESDQSGPLPSEELPAPGSTLPFALTQSRATQGLARTGAAKGRASEGLGVGGRGGPLVGTSDSRQQPAASSTNSSQRSKFQLSPEVPEFVPVSQLASARPLAHSEAGAADSAASRSVANSMVPAGKPVAASSTAAQGEALLTATASLSSTAPSFSPSYLVDKAPATLGAPQNASVSCEVVGGGGITATITVTVTGSGTGTITGSLAGPRHASEGARASLQAPQLSATASTSTGVVRGSFPFADLSWKQPTTALSYTSPSFTPSSLAKSSLSSGPGAAAGVGGPPPQGRGGASQGQPRHSVPGVGQRFSSSLKGHSPVPGLSGSLSITAPTFTPSSLSSPAPVRPLAARGSPGTLQVPAGTAATGSASSDTSALAFTAPFPNPSPALASGNSLSITAPTFVPSSGSLPSTPSGPARAEPKPQPEAQRPQPKHPQPQAQRPQPKHPKQELEQQQQQQQGRGREAVRRVQNAEEQASLGTLPGGASGGQMTGDSSRLSPTAPVFMPYMPSSSLGALALQTASTGSAGSASSALGAVAVVFPTRAQGVGPGGGHGAAAAVAHANGRGAAGSAVSGAAALRSATALGGPSAGIAGSSGVASLGSGLGFVPKPGASFLSPSAPAFTPGAPQGPSGQDSTESEDVGIAAGAFASSGLAAVAATEEVAFPGVLGTPSLGIGMTEGGVREARESEGEEIELPAELELLPDFGLLRQLEGGPLSQEPQEPSEGDSSALGDLSIWTRRAVSQNEGQGLGGALHDHNVWGTGSLGAAPGGGNQGAAGTRGDRAFGAVPGDAGWSWRASGGEGSGHVLERSASDPALGSGLGGEEGGGEVERSVPSTSAMGRETGGTGQASGQLSAAAKEFVPTQLGLGAAGRQAAPEAEAANEALGATTRGSSKSAIAFTSSSHLSTLSSSASSSLRASLGASAPTSASASSSPAPPPPPSFSSAPAASSTLASSTAPSSSSSSAAEPLDSFRFSWSGATSSFAWASPSPAPVHASLPLHFSLPTLWAGTAPPLTGTAPGLAGAPGVARAGAQGAGTAGPGGAGQVETELAPAYNSGAEGEGEVGGVARHGVPSQGLTGEGGGEPSGASFPAISMTRLAELIMSADAELAAQSPKAHELTEIDLLLPPDLLDPSPPKPPEGGPGAQAGEEEGSAPLGAHGLLAEESRRLSFAVQ